MKYLSLILSGLMFFTILAAVVRQLPRAFGANKDKYAVGQQWRYHTRAGEEKSTVTIVKVDEVEDVGTVVHVSVQGLRLKNPHTKTGYQESLPHIPLTEQAMNKSVVKLTKKKVALPAYEEGYRQWHEAFQAGDAGVFGIPVRDVVEKAEKAVNPQ